MTRTRYAVMCALGLALGTGAWAQTTQAAAVPTAELVRVLLTPGGETTLASPVAAKVQNLNATLGASFARGQTLVSFDCSEQTARLDMAKAELDGAVEQHEAKIRMQGLEQASDVEVAMAASAVANSGLKSRCQKPRCSNARWWHLGPDGWLNCISKTT